MIKFFRKIRQNLLSENKFSKYLIYAIGEILLVVIGIIIAVQIGNWNQSVQDKELLRISLDNLREDLELQKEIIDGQLANESEMIAKADSILMLMQKPIPSPSDIAPLLFELTTRRTFIANKATFNNLESTGNIVLIKDKELKNELIRYYQQLDYLTAVITNNNLFLIDNIYGVFVSNNGMKFGQNPDGSIRQDYSITPELRFTINSQVSSRKEFSEAIKGFTELQLELTVEMINLINEKLGDRPEIDTTLSTKR
ncbi:hypothetical protein [Aegicerativicinus sediminis]|uniref:hypothetical protein n=1 Tax=Aegicerativicinus sediminis TaxID=2893202 RepID=UPI001E2B3BAD|nr:hypothetical protein [Aegicerativicinus sediminis]